MMHGVGWEKRLRGDPSQMAVVGVSPGCASCLQEIAGWHKSFPRLTWVSNQNIVLRLFCHIYPPGLFSGDPIDFLHLGTWYWKEANAPVNLEFAIAELADRNDPSSLLVGEEHMGVTAIHPYHYLEFPSSTLLALNKLKKAPAKCLAREG